MAVTAQQVLRDLEKKSVKSVVLVVGDEPFQAADIEARFRSALIRTSTEENFNLELWDGEHLDVARLLTSLDTLPGLFCEAISKRLIILKQFDKVPAASMERLQSYFENPAPDTCLLIFSSRADRRRSVYRLIDQVGDWIEINEPYEREWPKWHPYFERKCGKKIESSAWEMLVAANRSLSLVWAEIEKLSLFIAAAPTIRKNDVLAFSGGVAGGDVFSFVDDVVNRRRREALEKLHFLLISGESEIKLLSLIVRQFRLMDQVKRLAQTGIVDPQTIASQIGIHRFGVGPLLQNARRYSDRELAQGFSLLVEADYRMKLGKGGLFENFLVGFLT